MIGLAVSPVNGTPPRECLGCTAFCQAGSHSVVVGKNLDWDLATGLLVTHPRSQQRNAIYGNVTFNQFGIELPLGGINEVGLVVEELSYSPSRYPNVGGRPLLNEFELIQYLLDRCATVDQALRAIGSVAVERRWMGLHYFLADRSGDAAVLEFLDGEAVIHHGADLMVPVLANDTYANSVRYLRRHIGFGGARRETDGAESPERFVRAARRLVEFKERGGGIDPTAFAFATLDAVRQDDTVWSIVYDVRTLAVHFRVQGYPGTRTVTFGELDLTAGGHRRVMDLTGALTVGGDSLWSDWTPVTEELLRQTVRDSLGIDIGVDIVEKKDEHTPTEPPPSALDLEVMHVQNAGVKIDYEGTSVLVDALLDLTVAPGQPPRLHDHLPRDLVQELESGLGPVGCVDAVFATHDHDDHFGIKTARRYLNNCSAAAFVCPAGMQAGSLPRMTAVDISAGGMHTAHAGPVKYSALPLRHSGENESTNARPHLAYAFYFGPWDVLHLGDAAVSEENLTILDRCAAPGRRVLLVPYWFLTDGEGVRWLRERSGARLIVVLHVNRGNRARVEESIAAVAGTLPPIVLPREHLQRIDVRELLGGKELRRGVYH